MSTKNVALILFVFQYLYITTQANCHLATQLQASNSLESDILKLVSKDLQNKKNFHPDCVTLSLEQRYWDVARALIKDYFLVKNIDLFPAFIVARKKIFRRDRPQFENLTGLLRLDSPSVIKVDPAFEWGQNMTFLFVRVKFTPKIDTPGGTDIQNINVTFKYDRFIVSALSLEGNFPIHYYLEIETYHHINTHICSWRNESTGRIVLEMKKSPAPYFWRNIHQDQFLKLPNQYMWWDVYYNYLDDFNSYGANALLLFDQRELERDRKEERQEFEEEMRKRDRGLDTERKRILEKMKLSIYRDLMYGSRLSDDRKYQVKKPLDWGYWI